MDEGVNSEAIILCSGRHRGRAKRSPAKEDKRVGFPQILGDKTRRVKHQFQTTQISQGIGGDHLLKEIWVELVSLVFKVSGCSRVNNVFQITQRALNWHAKLPGLAGHSTRMEILPGIALGCYRYTFGVRMNKDSDTP